MQLTIQDSWRNGFLKNLQNRDASIHLKEAALQMKLAAWTNALTSVVIATCEEMGWRACAKGYLFDFLPIARNEYLGVDVLAFIKGKSRWGFPFAAFELENSAKDDLVAYSLWKLLSLRTFLRVLFCYRKDSRKGSAIIAHLRDEVIKAMSLSDRVELKGETIVIVGSRAESESFPDGFFQWWQLDKNIGSFRLI